MSSTTGILNISDFKIPVYSFETIWHTFDIYMHKTLLAFSELSAGHMTKDHV